MARNTAVTCAFISGQSPQYTYGGSTIRPEQPALSTALASATASAVERAEIAATTGNPSQRFNAFHGLWTAAFVRGELGRASDERRGRGKPERAGKLLHGQELGAT